MVVSISLLKLGAGRRGGVSKDSEIEDSRSELAEQTSMAGMVCERTVKRDMSSCSITTLHRSQGTRPTAAPLLIIRAARCSGIRSVKICQKGISQLIRLSLRSIMIQVMNEKCSSTAHAIGFLRNLGGNG